MSTLELQVSGNIDDSNEGLMCISMGLRLSLKERSVASGPQGNRHYDLLVIIFLASLIFMSTILFNESWGNKSNQGGKGRVEV